MRLILPHWRALWQVCIGPLAVSAILWAPPAAAQTAIFDFDSATPTLSRGQGTPLDQTAGGITAHISSPSDYGGLSPAYSVQDANSTFWKLTQFSGLYLVPSTVYKASLDITFSQPITKISLSFATADFQQVEIPSPLQVTAYRNVNGTLTAVGSATAQGTYAGDTMPMGTLTYDSGGVPFDAVELFLPYYANGASDFLVDNIAVWAANASAGTLSLSPESVIGGFDTSTATLTLPAPAAATTYVSLTSSNTLAATVPLTVKFAAGQQTAKFAVKSKLVTADTAVTISAFATGVSASATLTVTPATKTKLAIAFQPKLTSYVRGTAITVIATLKDAAGNPLANQTVRLSEYVGSTSTTTVLTTAVTDSNGNVSVTYTVPLTGTSIAIKAQFNGSRPYWKSSASKSVPIAL